MWTRTVISVIVLALIGTYGCVPAVFRSTRAHEAVQQQLNNPALTLPSNDAPTDDPPMPSPSVSAPVHPVPQDAPQVSAGMNVRDSLEGPRPRATDVSPGQRVHEEREHRETTVFIAPSSVPVSTGEHKVAKEDFATPNLAPSPQPREQAPMTLQKARGPGADDRLLNLLEKDLNKAVEQPPKHRRLNFSKAVIDHPRVRYFIRDFSKNQKDFFAKALARSGRYFSMMARVLREEGLPQELVYLALIESNFYPHATSPSGALGLWQFIPETGRRYGLRIDSWIDERRDPVKSTRAAAAYLKDLHDSFGRWYLATAAYNAGQGTIKRAMQTSGAKDFWSLSDKAKLRDETRNFVPKFVAAALIASDPGKYGFLDVMYEEPLEYDEFEVAGNLSLAVLAEMAGCEVEMLQELNVELLRSRTPPGETAYRLKFPAGRGAAFAVAYQRKHEYFEVVTHEVKRGDTLFSIARRYGEEIRSLMEFNGLTSHRLRIGQKLKVILYGLRGGLR